MVCEVIVDIANSNVDKIFDYNVSDENNFKIGQRVLVPFGNRSIQGYILKFKDKSNVNSSKLKSVIKSLDDFSYLNEETINLMEYLIKTYNLRYADCLRLFVPNVVRKNVKEKFIKYAKLSKNYEKNNKKNNVNQQKIIDFLKTFEHYKEVKARMFYNQDKNDVAILNIENEDVMNELRNISSKTKYFSSKNEINGCYLKDGVIYYYDEKIIDRDLIKLPGIHNVENCLAAIMVCKEMGVSNKAICDVLTTFTGVEHRLEYVDTVDGVRYYNDTEATNIKCTQIALSSFDQDTTLILGGLERGQVFEDLTPYMTHVKNIVAIGQCRERVKEFGDSLHIPTYVYEKLEDGFKKCVEITKNGGIVLLSPASASWDQYKECEIRGAEFKQYVKNMKESEENED